jgi:type II secretory pathway pseudopilin PulG
MNLRMTSAETRRACAFTLAEVVVSIAIAAIVFGGTISAYIQTTRRAEWSGYSLAAQSLAIQQLEQARSAIWDTALGKNEVTNLALNNFTHPSANVWKGSSWTNLDIPVSGGNFTRATNIVTITMITNVGGVPAVSLQMVRVDTVWPFKVGNKYLLYTNSMSTYLAPDNRDAATF